MDTVNDIPIAEASAAPPGPPAWTGRDWLIAGLLACGFAPLLLQFFTNLWERPYYQFYPMALAGAVVLAKRGLDELPRPLAPGRNLFTFILMGGALGLFLVGGVLWSPWLGGIAALLCLAGVAWGTGGAPVLRAISPALLLLCTFIPPPVELDARLMVALRSVAVQWSSRMLDFLGVVHSLSGNVIDLPGRQLLVEEACSGINSVLLTLAVCVFYMFWRRRSLGRLLLCLPCVFAGVLLGNVVRICFGAWLQFYYRHDILSGWRHETVGLILLTGYLALILSLDEWLDFLTAPIRRRSSSPREAAGPPEVAQTPEAAAPIPAAPIPVAPIPVAPIPVAPIPVARVASPAAAAPAWLFPVAVSFAVLGVAGLGVRLSLHQQHLGLVGTYNLPAGTTFDLPAKIGEWQRQAAAAPFHIAQTQGVNSQVWNYQTGSLVASVAIDYPFRGYHDVTECYRLVGWTIDRAQRETPADTGIPDMAVELFRQPVSHASLWFSTMDETGNWLERAPAAKGFLERWQVSGQVQPNSYRVQLLISGYAPLLPAEREAARQLFVAARQQLVQQLKEKLRGKS